MRRVKLGGGVSSNGIRRIDHVGIVVRDVEVSEDWYCQVLGAEPFAHVGFGEETKAVMKSPFRHVFMMLGEQRIELVEAPDWRGFASAHDWALFPHYAFMVTEGGLKAFMGHFDECDVLYAGPIFHPPLTAASVYFCDPDANHLELTVWEGYPEGEGRIDLVPWNDLQDAAEQRRAGVAAGARGASH